MATDEKIITSVIETLQQLTLPEVSDQLTSILAKYQVPPENHIKMLMQTSKEIKARGARVKATDKEAYTKCVKLTSILSDYVSQIKQGNTAAAGATTSRRGGRKAKDNAKTNMTSYFEDIVPEKEEKSSSPVVWSDSELSEIKAEQKVKAEPVKLDAEEAFLEELLDEEEEVEEEFIKEEVIKEEEIKTEPYKEEDVVAAVQTKPKRGRSTAAKPADTPSRASRSTRTRAPEVVCIDSSSDESVPVEAAPVVTKPVPKKRGAPAKAAPAKRARATKAVPKKTAPPPPVEAEEAVAEAIPEAYVKYEDEDEEMPELDNAKPMLKPSPTKEKPVANVVPTQRQQKKVKPVRAAPLAPAAVDDDEESDDEEMGDNVIVNFTKENTPIIENSYSHIVLADKPETGMYPDNATPPTVTEVLALESCKIVQKPDMSLFELLQLIHSPEGQYLVVTLVDEAKLKQKNYHLLIPGVVSDSAATDKLGELIS